MGRYRRVEKALDIYVNALLVSPAMIFAPILFAIFGLSGAVRIAVIVLYSIFVIIMNTATAIRTVDPALVEWLHLSERMNVKFFSVFYCRHSCHSFLPAFGPEWVAQSRA